MIAYVVGKVVEISDRYVVVNVMGVGYKITISENSELWSSVKEGEELEVYTSQYFRETEQGLLGFATSNERNFFELLTTVSGVGPKLGSQIIANIEIPLLARMILDEDIAGISKAPGVGKKMSERMILELKDKVSEYSDKSARSGDKTNIQIATEDREFLSQALAKLGFSNNEIDGMMKSAEAPLKEGKAVEDVLSIVLGSSSD